MIVEIDRDAGLVTKRGETPDEAERVRREAEVLAVARHPGVVELVSSEGGSLRLRLVEAAADLAALSRTELLAVAASVATTLADLHDIGVVYGGHLEEHVLLDREGRPVLCSFGQAGSDQAAPADDVAALGLLFADVLSPLPPALARAMHPNRKRRPTPRALAAALAAPERAARPAARRRRVGVAAAGALTALVALVVVSGRHLPPQPKRCPAVDLGCHPVARPEGIFTTAVGRYRIGEPGDVMVVGRWSCASIGLPALLRRSSGEVWVFDHWASAGDDQPARLLTRVRGATSLLVAPGRSGCDRLLVTRRARPAVRVLPD